MSQAALTLTALGIVFGDIGTSPLYALREAFHGSHSIPVTTENIFGVLSLVVWSLIVVISIKYLLFVLRADNKGEGGVMALTAAATPPKFVTRFRFNRWLLYLGIFGSALLFGDGVITPAISVLSAVEGLKVATPLFEPYVIPITVAILGGLFFVQKHGTARIGSIFGPVLTLWFTVLGALGIYGITFHADILGAVNPMYAINYFASNGWGGFIVLSAVFLAVTGGEAMYADMGHFGRRPIQRAWFFVALPGLLLNYFGQGALILTNPEAAHNPFYLLAPSWALYPLVMLATIATVIASQALISGVFSLTRQAVQLGYFPRVHIIHTSGHEIGQIYIPLINWTLFIMTCWLVIVFKNSSSLAAAYGIAVSMTMVITTILACTVAFQRWRWSWYSIAGVLAVFLTVDLLFMVANFSKVADGGWVPLLMGAIIFIMITTWRTGRQILAQRLAAKLIPFEQFKEQLKNQSIARVPGTAIFMSGAANGVPLAMVHNVKHNKCIHAMNAIVTIVSEEVPYVPVDKRVEIIPVKEGFFRVIARYGFMDTPDMCDILNSCTNSGLPLDMKEATFFLGRETIIPSANPGMALWREHVFSFMKQNAERATDYFNIPPEQVVEVGIQVEI